MQSPTTEAFESFRRITWTLIFALLFRPMQTVVCLTALLWTVPKKTRAQSEQKEAHWTECCQSGKGTKQTGWQDKQQQNSLTLRCMQGQSTSNSPFSPALGPNTHFFTAHTRKRLAPLVSACWPRRWVAEPAAGHFRRSEATPSICCSLLKTNKNNSSDRIT